MVRKYEIVVDMGVAVQGIVDSMVQTMGGLIDPSEINISASGNISALGSISNYNEPVSIDEPEDAIDALELLGPFMVPTSPAFGI